MLLNDKKEENIFRELDKLHCILFLCFQPHFSSQLFQTCLFGFQCQVSVVNNLPVMLQTTLKPFHLILISYFKFKVEHTQMATKQLLLLICIIIYCRGPIGQKQSALSKMWTFGTHWNLKNMVNKSFSTAPLANQL